MKEQQIYLTEEQIEFLLRCKKEQNLSPEDCETMDSIIRDFSEPKVAITQTDTDNNILARKIHETELTTRTKNALMRSGLMVVRDITQMTEEQLGYIRNAGKKVQNEVKEFLNKYGLTLSKYVVYPFFGTGDEVEIFCDSLRSCKPNDYTGNYSYLKKGDKVRILRSYLAVSNPRYYSPSQFDCVDKNGIHYYCTLGQLHRPSDKE